MLDLLDHLVERAFRKILGVLDFLFFDYCIMQLELHTQNNGHLYFEYLKLLFFFLRNIGNGLNPDAANGVNLEICMDI